VRDRSDGGRDLRPWRPHCGPSGANRSTEQLWNELMGRLPRLLLCAAGAEDVGIAAVRSHAAGAPRHRPGTGGGTPRQAFAALAQRRPANRPGLLFGPSRPKHGPSSKALSFFEEGPSSEAGCLLKSSSAGPPKFQP